MRSLPQASREEEPLSVTEIITAGLAIIGFFVCSVILAKVAYIYFSTARRTLWLACTKRHLHERMRDV